MSARPLAPTSSPRSMTHAELADLPATVDLVTAGAALGIGRSTAYGLARRGEFPVPVLTIGAQHRVPTAALRAALGVPL